MPNGLYLRYYERLDEFKNNFNQTVAFPSEQNIHDLRVSIKKLRTILIFLQRLLPKSKEEITLLLKQILPIFKEAGIVRELQVLELQLNNENKELKIFLQEKIKLATRSFETTSQNFDSDSWIQYHAKLLKSTKTVHIKTIEQNLNNHFRSIYFRILQRLKSETIRYHQIRKGFKNIAELLSLWTQINPKNPFIPYSEKIKEINTRLGNWHDHEVNISFLKSLNIDQSEDLKQLQEQFSNQKSNIEKGLADVDELKVFPENLIYPNQNKSSFSVAKKLLFSLFSLVAILFFSAIFSTEKQK